MIAPPTCEPRAWWPNRRSRERPPGAKMAGMDTPLLGFSHFQLMVSDVDASREWYETVLGLEPFVTADDGSYVGLHHRPSHLVILLMQRGGAMPDDPGDVVDHLAFAVHDGEILQDWADHLTDAGIKHPGIVLEDRKPSLQLRDPDGVAIELIAPAPRV